ncbi:MAG: alpha/beta hydrolase [Microlunatus sp.]
MRITVNHTKLFVDVEGAELAVSDGSLRPRPVVVILHGGPGFDQGYLRPGLSALADHAQLFFVDLRGQGRSEPIPVESCTLEQMADDVAVLCSELGLARPVIFGHSAGGFVALQLALRHPGSPGGLILCHTAPTIAPGVYPSPPGPAERGDALTAAAAAALFSGDFSAEAAESFGRLVFPLYAAPGHEEIPPKLMALSRLDIEITAHFFTRLAAGYDVRPRLGEIDLPTLVVTGHHDWVCPPSAGRDIAEAIHGARLVELTDAGHFGFSEAPGPFLEAVRAYLANLPSERVQLPDQAEKPARSGTG